MHEVIRLLARLISYVMSNESRLENLEEGKKEMSQELDDLKTAVSNLRADSAAGLKAIKDKVDALLAKAEGAATAEEIKAVTDDVKSLQSELDAQIKAVEDDGAADTSTNTGTDTGSTDLPTATSPGAAGDSGATGGDNFGSSS